MPSDPNSSAKGRVKFSDRAISGVKVFSATMVQEREQLGDKVSAWLQEHPEIELTEVVVTQSSDEAFHCLTLTIMFAKV